MLTHSSQGLCQKYSGQFISNILFVVFIAIGTCAIGISAYAEPSTISIKTPTKINTEQLTLPQQAELEELLKLVEDSPQSSQLWNNIGEIKLAQAKVAQVNTSQMLVKDAIAAFEKSKRAQEFGDYLQGTDKALTNAYVILAATSVEKEKSALFAKAFQYFRGDIRRNERQYEEWYLTSADWVITLLNNAQTPHMTKEINIALVKEALRVLQNPKIMKTSSPNQDIHHAYAFIVASEQAENQRELLEKALSILDMTIQKARDAEAPNSRDSSWEAHILVNDAMLLKALAFSSLASLGTKEEQSEYLDKAYEAIQGLPERSFSYMPMQKEIAAYISAQYEKHSTLLGQQALFWANHALLKKLQDEYLEPEKLVDLFEKAIALDSKNEKIWLSFAQSMFADRYVDISDEKIKILTKAACMAQENGEAWSLWDEVTWGNMPYFENEQAYNTFVHARTSVLRETKAEEICPAFFNYAQAVFSMNRIAKDDASSLDTASLDFLQQALKHPHPKQAEAFIYGHIATLYFNTQRSLVHSEPQKQSEILEYQQVAQENFIKSLHSYNSYLDWAELSRIHSWASKYIENLDYLLSNPDYPITESTLLQAKEMLSKHYEGETNTQMLDRWTNALLDYAHMTLNSYGKNAKAHDHAKEFLDITIAALEQAKIAEEPPAWFYSKLALVLTQKANLEKQGERLPVLLKAQEVLKKDLQKAESSTLYKNLMEVELLMTGEVPESEISALLDSAYEHFLLTSGAPAGIKTTKNYWSKTLALQQPP